MAITDLKKGDQVKVYVKEGVTCSGFVSTVDGACLWVNGCDGVYWREDGRRIGFCQCDDPGCQLYMDSKYGDCIPRIEEATEEELRTLLDVRYL